MPRSETRNLRNIALAGHAGSGKTTLVETILHHLGLIGRAGTIEEGNTVCDYEPEEKEHKHSLSSALVNFDHEGQHFNIIDTPGMPDFIGQAIGAFPAVGTVAVVIGADKGIQTVTRRVMRVAKERNFPRFIIVNKIDDHVDELEGLLASIREMFGPECIPINLPTPDGSDVIDAWEKSEGEVAFGTVNEAHTNLVDQCVEMDEELMSVYLEQGNLTPEQLHDAFEKALREAHLVPVCFCSAKTGAGIEDLLHILANLCPDPTEANPRPFILTKPDGSQEEWHAEPDAGKPVVATRVDGARELVDASTGALVALESPRELGAALAELTLLDPDERARLGEAAQARVREGYTIDAMVEGLLAVYGELA